MKLHVASTPGLDDVLYAFAVEPNHDSETLQRYLKEYPQYAVEIASLSHELSRKVEEAAISEKDKALIDEAWKKFRQSAVKSQEHWRIALAPFAEKFNEIAKVLLSFSAAELRYMLECAEQATTTNCSWQTYAAAQHIKNTCTTELQVRAFNAAVKQKNSTPEEPKI